MVCLRYCAALFLHGFAEAVTTKTLLVSLPGLSAKVRLPQMPMSFISVNPTRASPPVTATQPSCPETSVLSAVGLKIEQATSLPIGFPSTCLPFVILIVTWRSPAEYQVVLRWRCFVPESMPPSGTQQHCQYISVWLIICSSQDGFRCGSAAVGTFDTGIGRYESAAKKYRFWLKISPDTVYPFEQKANMI